MIIVLFIFTSFFCPHIIASLAPHATSAWATSAADSFFKPLTTYQQENARNARLKTFTKDNTTLVNTPKDISQLQALEKEKNFLIKIFTCYVTCQKEKQKEIIEEEEEEEKKLIEQAERVFWQIPQCHSLIQQQEIITKQEKQLQTIKRNYLSSIPAEWSEEITYLINNHMQPFEFEIKEKENILHTTLELQPFNPIDEQAITLKVCADFFMSKIPRFNDEGTNTFAEEQWKCTFDKCFTQIQNNYYKSDHFKIFLTTLNATLFILQGCLEYQISLSAQEYPNQLLKQISTLIDTQAIAYWKKSLTEDVNERALIIIQQNAMTIIRQSYESTLKNWILSHIKLGDLYDENITTIILNEIFNGQVFKTFAEIEATAKQLAIEKGYVAVNDQEQFKIAQILSKNTEQPAPSSAQNDPYPITNNQEQQPIPASHKTIELDPIEKEEKQCSDLNRHQGFKLEGTPKDEPKIIKQESLIETSLLKNTQQPSHSLEQNAPLPISKNPEEQPTPTQKQELNPIEKTNLKEEEEEKKTPLSQGHRLEGNPNQKKPEPTTPMIIPENKEEEPVLPNTNPIPSKKPSYLKPIFKTFLLVASLTIVYKLCLQLYSLILTRK